MKKRVILVLLVVGLLAAACGDDEPKDDDAGMANPASVYCTEQGGTLDIREGESGQHGVCVFDDGSECGEWDFYHGECAPGQAAEEAGGAGLPNPASAFCEEQGGTVDIREGEGGQYGVCVFDDGSECDEWQFFRGECAPGA